MADKNADRPDDVKQREPDRDTSRPFINEKIVRPPVTKRQLARRIVLTAFCAALFGVLAAVCFVVTAPVAGRFLGHTLPNESAQVTIPRDEPESTTAPPETTVPPEAPSETEPLEEMVRSELNKYPYSMEDLNKLYGHLRTLASQADASMVVVHSIQRERDWFDNPIETTGQFSGAVIAKSGGEILILTPEAAVEAADSIEVVFPDGTVMEGAVKQRDSIMGMAVVSVDGTQMDSQVFEDVQAIVLGNSYGVKQGDVVVAVGAPAGISHSSDYGFISYVIRNVQTIDGTARVFYANTAFDAAAGTFLVNTSGELIGWATDKYTEKSGSMATVVAISDYKGILELLSNGVTPPYFGIKGQDVSQAMEESGMPKGVYVTEAVADSPAYNAGIQPGDVITWMNGQEVGNMKDFQNQVEKFHEGDPIKVAVQRNNGRDEYKEIEFDVTIGAR